jgi:hypothetical protein
VREWREKSEGSDAISVYLTNKIGTRRKGLKTSALELCWNLKG